MQSVRNQTVTLPFESMTDNELAHYCNLMLRANNPLPERAQRELIRRVEYHADNSSVYTKYVA